jgi:hypothetical protein
MPLTYQPVDKAVRTMSRENAKPVKWAGKRPKACDLCSVSLDGVDFVDGRTVYGPWANMCLPCHETSGLGLGTGLGQKFDKDGLKVGG